MGRPRDYAIEGQAAGRRIDAPRLPYLPRDPKRYRPNIGLIGCGGITSYHLKAYRAAGYEVVALCNPDESKARARQKEFYPAATTYTDYRQLLRREDIDVVDIATHPRERVAIIKAAITAGKHILSQKPFVTDLDVGERLVDLAAVRGVKIAVNQNGRWAPHFAYLRTAIQKGLLGRVSAVHQEVHWDHNWVAGSAYENIRHLVLFDFGVHWFDILSCFMGDRLATHVCASVAESSSQRVRPPLLAQAIVEYDQAQASLVFDADVRYGQEDRTFVAGEKGALLSTGPNLGVQRLTLSTAKGIASPELQGSWFASGFHGTMAELLCAIEEDREPSNSGRNNLKSLALCFAACASADRGRPVTPGRIRRLPT